MAFAIDEFSSAANTVYFCCSASRKWCPQSQLFRRELYRGTSPVLSLPVPRTRRKGTRTSVSLGFQVLAIEYHQYIKTHLRCHHARAVKKKHGGWDLGICVCVCVSFVLCLSLRLSSFSPNTLDVTGDVQCDIPDVS